MCYRRHVLSEICGVDIPKTSEFQKFWEWKDAVLARESVTSTLVPDFWDQILPLYRKYAAVRTEIPK